MRKLIHVLMSTVLGVGLLAGFLVANGHSTPQLNTDTIQKVGFGGDNTSSKTSSKASTCQGEFAQPGSGEWFKGGKHHPNKVFAGRWCWHKPDGTVITHLICTGFTLHSGDGVHWDTVHKIPGFTTANSKAAFKIGNADEGLLSKVTGLSKVSKIDSVVAWSVWFLSNDKNLHADWSSTYVPQLKNRGEYGAVQKLIAWAKTHGPYKVTVKAPQVQPGHTGNGVVTVLGSNGKPASHLQVSLSGSNVKLSTQGGLTNSKGQFHFKYTPQEFGGTSIGAHITAPSSTTGTLTDASPGRQRLLTGNFVEHASGSTHFKSVAAKATAKNLCVTNCDGIATAQWTGIAPKDSAVRIKFHTDAGINARCDARAGSTCTVSRKVPDGTHWTSYEFCVLKNGKCVTKYFTVKKDKEFICPPEPVATVDITAHIDCPCDGPVTFTHTLVTKVTSLAGSSRFYTTTLTDVTNGKSDTVNLTNGTPGSPDLPFVNGDQYKLTYKSYDHKGGHLLKQGTILTFSDTLAAA